jgi:hypothetical protein
MRTKTTLLALSGVVGSGVVGGLTYAAVSSPAAASTSAGSANSAPVAAPFAHRFDRGGMFRRIEHGQLTLQTRTGDRTVDLQRGKVTAVSPTSISVESPDGFTATYAVTSATKVRVARTLGSIAGVHDGDRVFVVASGGKALRVLDRT